MQHRKTALFALALVISLPLVALAAPDFGERGGRARHILPPADYLDLSDEQIEAAEALREDARADFENLRTETRDLRQQIEAALADADPDPTQVGQLVIDLKGQRERMGALRADVEARFAALLSEEQIAKWENFKELRESRRDRRHGGRFGKRFHEGPGRF